jgi:hypothetical protein
MIVGTALSVVLASCGTAGNEKTDTSSDVKTTMEEAAPAEDVEEPAVNVEAHVKMADALRTEIEASLDAAEKVELATEGLRSQIAQKWSMIHYYKSNGNVVRIKTYPHEGVSNRTEEFYFNDGALAMVVIEDNGSGERGKEKESVDKIYYFHDGEMIEEAHNTAETEYGIRKSDGERLMQEAAEYMELMP